MYKLSVGESLAIQSDTMAHGTVVVTATVDGWTFEMVANDELERG
jgi:hypothetical protein